MGCLTLAEWRAAYSRPAQWLERPFVIAFCAGWGWMIPLLHYLGLFSSHRGWRARSPIAHSALRNRELPC